MPFINCLIAILIVLVLCLTGIFETLNNFVYDSYIISNQQNSLNEDIIIIEIDNKSVKQLGYWPWKRTVYANVIEKIINASPAVIGIDLSFSITQGNPEEDLKLYNVLKSFQSIVLSSSFISKTVDNISVIIPEKSLFPDIKKGHVLLNDRDIVRAFPPFKVIPAFSLQVLQLYNQNSKTKIIRLNKLKSFIEPSEKHSYSIKQEILIDYKRKPDKFQHISFVNILNDKVNLNNLTNKIVLLGVTDTYLTPIYLTPFNLDKKEQSHPSIEIQAQIIDSLMHYRGLIKCPTWLTLLISILIALSFFIISKTRRFFIQGIGFILSLIVVVLIDYAMFIYLNYWFPPMYLIAMLVIIFGFYIYFTINKINLDIVDSINKLGIDDNILLIDIPVEVNDKVEFFNSLVSTISNDRQIIKSIINGVNNGILVFEQSGKILWSNSTFLSFFEESLVLGISIENLIKDINLEEIIKCNDENNIYQKEVILSERDFQVSINKISSRSENFIAILNDITDLKNIERLRTDMIRMLSHEIKNPLLNISLASEDLIDFTREDYVKTNSKIINKSSELITDIINDFLNLNKLESNLINLNIEKVDIKNLILNSIKLHEILIERKYLNIVVNQDTNNLDVFVDKKLINIVINNLLSNAIKYSYDNGEIIIDIIEENDSLKISIEDKGLGIREDEKELVFNKFYRASNNEEVNIEGTGLGLSIVKKILALHNSEIMLETEYEKGCKFSFYLKI